MALPRRGRRGTTASLRAMPRSTSGEWVGSRIGVRLGSTPNQPPDDANPKSSHRTRQPLAAVVAMRGFEAHFCRALEPRRCDRMARYHAKAGVDGPFFASQSLHDGEIIRV